MADKIHTFNEESLREIQRQYWEQQRELANVKNALTRLHRTVGRHEAGQESAAGQGGLYFANEQTSPTPTRSSPQVDSGEGYILDPIEAEETPKYADMQIYGPPGETGTLPAAVTGRVLNYTPFGYYNGTNHRLDVIKTGDVYIVRKPQSANRAPIGILDISFTDTNHTTGGSKDPTSITKSGYSVFQQAAFSGAPPYVIKYLPRTTVRYRVYGWMRWSATWDLALDIPAFSMNDIDIATLQGNPAHKAIDEFTPTPSTVLSTDGDFYSYRAFSGEIEVAYTSTLDAITITIENVPAPKAGDPFATTFTLTGQLVFDPIW